MKSLSTIGKGLGVLIALLASIWALGALSYDGPGLWFGLLGTFGVFAAMAWHRLHWRAWAIWCIWFTAVLVWWLGLKPSNEGEWQADVARIASAEVDGDVVTIRNVRNFDYYSEGDPTPRWEARKVRISQITGVDMAVTYWGSPYMAHPIVSFQFADSPPLCFSIETRKRIGQTYSAIGGLYRQFTLACIVADERDVIRVRTNYREGEQVYLYRLTLTPEQARVRFIEYLATLNRLHEQPRWYNAITTNCTTAIRSQHPVGERIPWDWRILVNGKADKMLYERGALVTGGLGFDELKQRSHINPAASAANNDPGFSGRIRAGNPGMKTP